ARPSRRGGPAGAALGGIRGDAGRRNRGRDRRRVHRFAAGTPGAGRVGRRGDLTTDAESVDRRTSRRRSPNPVNWGMWCGTLIGPFGGPARCVPHRLRMSLMTGIVARSGSRRRLARFLAALVATSMLTLV